jgi:hypothetical protein
MDLASTFSAPAAPGASPADLLRPRPRQRLFALRRQRWLAVAAEDKGGTVVIAIDRCSAPRQKAHKAERYDGDTEDRHAVFDIDCEALRRVTETPSSMAATLPRRLPAGARSQRSFGLCALWPAVPRRRASAKPPDKLPITYILATNRPSVLSSAGRAAADEGGCVVSL